MKKPYFLLGVAILIAVSFVVLRLKDFRHKPEIGKIKLDNIASPSAPTNNISPAATAPDGTEATFSQEALVVSPKQNELISSPVKIQGNVVGSWFFEATLPVKLVDSENNVIAAGHATAESDWMTIKPVRFSAELPFSLASTTATSGYIVISKDNPSDLPQNDGSIKVPVRLR